MSAKKGCSDGTNSDECLPTMVGCLELGQVVCTDMAIFLWCIMPQEAGIRRMLLTSRTGVHPRQALWVRTPGVEPGSQAWGACMMPLHYVRWW